MTISSDHILQYGQSKYFGHENRLYKSYVISVCTSPTVFEQHEHSFGILDSVLYRL